MYLRLSTLALIGSLSIHAAALAAPSENEAAILKIEQDLTVAQTAAAVTAAWAENGVFEDFTPGEVRGLAALRKDLEVQFSQTASFTDQILRIKVEADNHLGFAYSTQHLVAQGKGVPDVDMVFRQTDCYRKKDGKWQLVYQHLSVPFDAKTGKAVFDSK